MAQFKQEILDKIKDDPILFGLVADALELKPSSLTMALQRKSGSLTKYECVIVVAEYLKLDPKEILEEETESQAAA